MVNQVSERIRMIFRQRDKIREYWQNLMRSTHVKISQGAYEIYRAMPWAKGDCWRRNDKIQRGHEPKGKK